MRKQIDRENYQAEDISLYGLVLGQGGQRLLSKSCEKIKKMPEVGLSHIANSGWDSISLVKVQTPSELAQTVVNKIQAVSQQNTHTGLVLQDQLEPLNWMTEISNVDQLQLKIRQSNEFHIFAWVLFTTLHRQMEYVMRDLKNIEQVGLAFPLSGAYHAAALVRVESMGELGNQAEGLIRNIPGITSALFLTLFDNSLEPQNWLREELPQD